MASDPALNSVSEPGSWQIYGYDLGNSFFSPEDAPPPRGEIAWQYGKPGDVFAPPLFKDGILYVLYGTTCTVVALEATTGVEIWVRKLDPDCPQARSLSLAGGILYVSIDGILHGGEDFIPLVYALDRKSGEVLWQQETCSSWPFFVSQGLGYQINFASSAKTCEKSSSFIEIFDAATGEKLKTIPLTFLSSSEKPLLLFDNQHLYLKQEEYIYALNQHTYESVWEKHIEGLSSVQIIEDKLYADGEGAFIALDAQTGKEVRRIERPRIWEGRSNGIAGVVYNMIIVIQSIDYTDTIYALSIDQGKVLWEFPLNASLSTSSTFANGRMYFGTKFVDEEHISHDKIYALDVATGEVIWILNTPPLRYSVPIIVDGVVYIGAYTGEVIAIR